MAAPYRKILDTIRTAFPKPVSDRVHDSYFVHSLMRAIDAVDTLKSERPILGVRKELDYGVAKKSRLAEEGKSVEEVTQELVKYCEGLTLWGHPRTQQNVVPPVTISSLIGVLLSSLYNPNLAWDEYSHRVALAEVEVVTMLAVLLGYDPERAGGVFTFGGTGTMLYGMKLGLGKALAWILWSRGFVKMRWYLPVMRSHYCRYNIAGWLGLGSKNLITIPTTRTQCDGCGCASRTGKPPRFSNPVKKSWVSLPRLERLMRLVLMIFKRSRCYETNWSRSINYRMYHIFMPMRLSGGLGPCSQIIPLKRIPLGFRPRTVTCV